MKLVIGNTVVKMKDGLYCLNDLHKASGGEKKNGPSYWSALSQTKDFLETTQMSVVKLEGRGGGTYAEKKAVYSYAMHIITCHLWTMGILWTFIQWRKI